MGGVATAGPAGEIMVFGGDRGDLLLRLEALDRRVETLRRDGSIGLARPEGEAARIHAEVARCLAEKKSIYESHPGFARDVLAYEPRTDTWRVAAQSPAPLPVTTIAVQWDGTVVIPSGEIRPGVRTAGSVRVRFAAP